MTLIFRVLLLAFIASHALSDQLIAGQNDWPPFFSKARTDQGIAIALVREIFAKSGYQVEFNDTPWSRAIATVKSGQMDILPGVWDNAERKQYLVYSEPYLYNRIVFIKRKGDDFEFQGLASLQGKRVGVIQDYNYGDEFLRSNLFRRDPALALVNNIKKLLSERIDLTLEDEIVAKQDLLLKAPDLLPLIEFTESSLREVGLHIACGKVHPNCPLLIQQFNAGLKAMQEDGSLAKFLRDQGI